MHKVGGGDPPGDDTGGRPESASVPPVRKARPDFAVCARSANWFAVGLPRGWRGQDDIPSDWGRYCARHRSVRQESRGQRPGLIAACGQVRPGACGILVVLTTFDPHPDGGRLPGQPPAQLTYADASPVPAEELGIDVFLVMPFHHRTS